MLGTEVRAIVVRSGPTTAPIDDPGTIEAMLRHADLIVTARVGGQLVGVSRAITDFSFCTYLSDLAVDQAFQKRIADVLIDLFVGLCVISRADAIARTDPGSADQVYHIAKVFTRQARQRISRNLRRITHNDDAAMDRIAAHALERGYAWDVI